MISSAGLDAERGKLAVNKPDRTKRAETTRTLIKFKICNIPNSNAAGDSYQSTSVNTARVSWRHLRIEVVLQKLIDHVQQEGQQE